MNQNHGLRRSLRTLPTQIEYRRRLVRHAGMHEIIEIVEVAVIVLIARESRLRRE
jgi:hypothetical protein